MALTKAGIVSHLTNHLGFSKKQASETIETLLEFFRSTLASGEDFLDSGFGKFCVKTKNERRVKSPAIVKDMVTALRLSVSF